MKGRVVFEIELKPGAEDQFLAAYEQIRHEVAEGVPGHLADQVCRLRDGDGTWLITSEWERLERFIEWERSEAHRELAAPLRACIQSARSLKFDVVAETVNPHPERNHHMQRAHVNGVELEYELAGSGEPVVLLHGGLLADENTPLVRQPALTDRYRVLNYHRRGFAGSTTGSEPASIADQAADALALMRHVGFESAHVVGHSLGGAIALQLALDAPQAVRSLVLLEPALMGAIARVQAAARPEAAASQRAFIANMEEVWEVSRRGDKREALLLFLRSRAGQAFSGVLEYLKSSGEFDQAVADADTFLHAEMPAAFRWGFTPEQAGRISQPVLSVLGSHSPERPQHVHRVLTEWVPQTELLTLANAEHALPMMNPPELAAALATYFDRHALVRA
jgi:pimeloyl-ACP methyl ester carboxylesterase/heme-degrading monooxygenase HmoA